MESKKIRVYHTHIEISPYQYQENIRIENMMSKWNNVERTYYPIAFMIIDDTLYLPRGFSIPVLENTFESTAFTIQDCDKSVSIQPFEILTTPRDSLQEDSINFLSGLGDFKYSRRYSQMALILDTGAGKTVITVSAISKLRERTIIITHQNKIKKQWMETFKNLTTIEEDKIVELSTTLMDKIVEGEEEATGDIYMVSHQTLESYMRKFGFPELTKFFKVLKVGLKIYDEAHLEFQNIIRIDMLTNTKRTIYLTATFNRSDASESKVYQKAFSATVKYGEDKTVTRKHVIYLPVLYRSKPTAAQVFHTMTGYGFSALRFSEYALRSDPDHTMLTNLLYVMEKAVQMEGKILITTSRIQDTIMIQETLQEIYPDKVISTIHSKRTKEENTLAKDADIICSTIKSCGTGVDIKKLRVLINMEPFSSAIICNQLMGRLREYAPDKDTCFFDLVDLAFPSCERQYENRLQIVRKKCKQVAVMRL